MVVGDVHHPRLDEGVGARNEGSKPGAKLRNRLGNTIGSPFVTVKSAADAALKFVVTQRIRLTDEEGRDRWELVAVVHSEDQGFDHIILM